MSNSIIVWDLKTVPNFHGYAAVIVSSMKADHCPSSRTRRARRGSLNFFIH